MLFIKKLKLKINRATRKAGQYPLKDYNGPDYATVLVDTRCGNRCLYCVNHNEDSKNYDLTKGIYIKDRFLLSLRDFKRIIDILKESDGVKKIHICAAGEPFYNKNIMDFIDYAIDLFGAVSFQTNFRTPFKKLIPEVSQKKISYITTDIVGGTKESFEKIKAGSKWNELWENINYLEQECKKHNKLIKLNICVVLNKQSITHDNLIGLVDQCLKHKSITNLNFVNIMPFGFNEFVSSENRIREDDLIILEKVREAENHAKENNISVNPMTPYKKNKKIQCDNFWRRIMVNFPNDKLPREKWIGNVMPGGCFAETMGEMHSIGNIFDNDFWDIWNCKKMTEARRKSLMGCLPDKACELCSGSYKG